MLESFCLSAIQTVQFQCFIGMMITTKRCFHSICFGPILHYYTNHVDHFLEICDPCIFNLFQIYVPLTLIVCCSWVTFWLMKTDKGSEIPARTSLGATTVLSVVTIGFGGKGKPQVSSIFDMCIFRKKVQFRNTIRFSLRAKINGFF